MPLSAISKSQTYIRPSKKQASVAEKPRMFRAVPVKSNARRSHTSRKKIKALSYWAKPSIPEKGDLTGQKKRVPTVLEVSAYFGGIPGASISKWRGDENDILKTRSDGGW